MSRFDSFSYFEDNQIQDLNVILQHQGVTVDVYRPTTGESPGFETELGEMTRVDRVLMYISSDALPTQVGVSDMRANLQEYVGVTNNKHLRINDELRVPGGNTYRINAIQEELDNIIMIALERIL